MIKKLKEIKSYSRELKAESLRKALIEAGYDMASSQAESMVEDKEFWGNHIIEGKINPKCIDISDQAGHSFYNNELDIWLEPDEKIFPEGCDEGGLNESLKIMEFQVMRYLVFCIKAQTTT